MKETIKSIFVSVIYLLLFLSYGVGLVHSFKKHGVADGLIGSVAFPWAIYRGVESLWHDDYKDVDWNAKLNNDTQTCIYFISSVNNSNVNKYELNEGIEKFSNKIKKYPDDKIETLKNTSKTYILFVNSITNDLYNAISEYKTTGYYNLNQSDKTIELENQMIKYNLKEHVDLVKKSIDDINSKTSGNILNEIDIDKIELFQEKMKIGIEIYQKEYLRVYKSLFNEDFKF